MADVDPDRWHALLAAYRNSVDASPPFLLLQTAHNRALQAQSDLERFKVRGALGRRDQCNPDMQASFQRGVDELTQRVAEADREVKRIEALQRQSAAQRVNLQQHVDGVRQWAHDNSITLPSEGDVHDMTGFAASTVRIATPTSSTARSWP
jgi:hypothetical protein